MQKLNALIADPDSEWRNKLSLTLSAMPLIKEVEGVDVLERVLRTFLSERHFDLVFVSSEFPPRESFETIRGVRENPLANETAFILLLPAEQEIGTSLRSRLMSGFDGALVRPYSPERVESAIDMARTVRLGKNLDETKSRFAVLIDELRKQLDVVWAMKKLDYDPKAEIRRLQDMSLPVQALRERELKIYFELVTELFEEALPPKVPPNPLKYGGRSQRARRRVEQAFVDEMRELNDGLLYETETQSSTESTGEEFEIGSSYKDESEDG